MTNTVESALASRSLRQQFLPLLFRQAVSLDYAFLKYMYASLAEIPAETDVDLLVEKKDLKQWEALLRQAPGLKRVSIRHTSFAAYCSLFFEDGSFLSVDLIIQFKRTTKVFLEAQAIIRSAVKNREGIWMASVEHNLEYVMLFYGLNGAQVPEKYFTYLRNQNKVIQAAVRRFIQQKYGLDIWKLDQFTPTQLQERLTRHMEGLYLNRGSAGWKLRWAYFRDQFRRPQPTITLSGVDGAGKSTILEHVREMLHEKYRREVVSLRQRPSILPILSSFKYGKQQAEARAASTLPRQGTNQSRLSSLLRFVWYYLDYLLGQWVIQFTVNRRGRILLYDRYYFDYIADSKRANIVLSSQLIRRLYRWVFKPELNIVLVADPDVILARKQELSREEIESLTTAYTELFESLEKKGRKGRYLIIHNHDLQETLDRIEAAVVDILI
jgi:thymidylate kinase